MNVGPSTAQRAAIGVVLGLLAGRLARWSVGGADEPPPGLPARASRWVRGGLRR